MAFKTVDMNLVDPELGTTILECFVSFFKAFSNTLKECEARAYIKERTSGIQTKHKRFDNDLLKIDWVK